MTTWIAWGGPASEVGGKAASLAALSAARLPIPAWFAVRPPASISSTADLPTDMRCALDDAVRKLLRDAEPGARLAVRSSALDEDGVRHSFAGQFESYLFVAPEDVAARVLDVWRSAESARVEAYRKEHALEEGTRLPAVLVQRMIDPDASGVAFSADPVSGQRGICVVDAVYGVGNESRVRRGQRGLVPRRPRRGDRRSADLFEAQRAPSRRGRRRRRRGIRTIVSKAGDRRRPGAWRGRARARAARRISAGRRISSGRSRGGQAVISCSRAPITSLEPAAPTPTRRCALWDNSNITESYGGVTTPLTFSFARYVYEEVYRQFCRVVGVPDERIAENADALRAMLGLVRGRIYYNLVSWYRLLALFPGFTLNRAFMEQMMGVKEGIPAEVAQRLAPSRGGRLRETGRVLRTLGGLVLAYRRLPTSIAAFHARLDRALDTEKDLGSLRADELVAHYRDLERELLTRWDAPLINDFFAMVFYGVARKLVVTWCGAGRESLLNDLVSGGGEIVSAEPATRIARMAALAAPEPALVDALVERNACGSARLRWPRGPHFRTRSTRICAPSATDASRSSSSRRRRSTTIRWCCFARSGGSPRHKYSSFRQRTSRLSRRRRTSAHRVARRRAREARRSPVGAAPRRRPGARS